jgi:putative restriction endonuclease
MSENDLTNWHKQGPPVGGHKVNLLSPQILPPAHRPHWRLDSSQGFRNAVVRIYDHRCAFCGVRMLTSDGRTAVDAGHIIPWSISYDDDPHNGMAMCGLCHWTFDQGLLSVSVRYLALLSGELRISQNVPGHLLTLESRSIIGPAEQDLWPHLEAFDGHRLSVFRRG